MNGSDHSEITDRARRRGRWVACLAVPVLGLPAALLVRSLGYVGDSTSDRELEALE